MNTYIRHLLIYLPVYRANIVLVIGTFHRGNKKTTRLFDMALKNLGFLRFFFKKPKMSEFRFFL